MAPLDLVAAQDIDRLRRQAHVGANRNAALGKQAYGICQPGCAFELDHVCAGLHQHGAVGERLVGGGISHEWQVSQNQRALIAALDAGNVVGHFSRGDRQRAVVPLQYHAQGVAHEQDLNAGLAGGLREGRVVAGQHGYFLTLELQALQGGQGNVWHEKVSSVRRCENYGVHVRGNKAWNRTSSGVLF
ncbi:hypothetical protein D3C76_1241200 [compost metagenome]